MTVEDILELLEANSKAEKEREERMLNLLAIPPHITVAKAWVNTQDYMCVPYFLNQ
ncbi:hypothetical protein RMSM_07829 [Rhodopirellula maiorica SM1]|uniref:Uncharacterized protein n=2 Tax=Novipirellula TaxID=2795426 RepID=M5R883_9BACT|nr:hypothetical protein RMSM_07829 [Rhodopirellula maiorica SM1]